MLKHVLEALLDSDLFGEPSNDSRARVILLQRAQHCMNALRKIGLSDEGALHEVNKLLARDPLSSCESPIEKIMMASLVFENWYPFLTLPAAVLHPGEKSMTKGDLVIAPQFNFGPYRLDLLIFGHDDEGKQKLVNVECDGNEYHNTTMAKYQDDRERDKFLRACRIEVFRFSGSDIWNNASRCAEEVALSLKRWRWMNWSKAVVKAA